MNDAAELQAPAPAMVHRAEFVGARRDFLRLLAWGALLEFLTLGFYRFWLATDMRRHMWSHTSAGGDTFEYTGTARELLLGFLFALAILIPLYLVYFFIGIELERYQAMASIPLALFFYLFLQFAFYRARRYRISRTVWRGVRFWMTGSGWVYALRAFLWLILVIATVGLALPWYLAAIERYKMRHTYYGELPCRFEGSGWQFFKRAGWIWLLGLLALVLLVVATAFMVSTVFSLDTSGELDEALLQKSEAFARAAIGLGGLTLLVLVGFPFAYAAYKAMEWRWWIGGLRLGEVRFESSMRANALIGLYWQVIGWTMLISALFLGAFAALGVLAADAQGRLAPETVVRIVQNPSILIGVAAGYLAAALAFGVVTRLYLRRDVWVRVVSTTLVHNLAATEDVAARGHAAGALGEGLSDSLDVGGF